MENETQKSNKKWYQKWWVWLIIVLVVVAIGQMDDEDEAATDEEEQELNETNNNDDIENETDDETENKEDENNEDSHDQAEPASTEEPLTLEQKLEENNSVDRVTFEDGTLTLETEATSLWSENSLLFTVYDLFEVTKEAFDDSSVDEVKVFISTKMVDEKGHESVDTVIEYHFTRESFEELNYDNFSNMAYGQPYRILNVSDYYSIHPGIYKNFKNEYKENLSLTGP